ncbi:MAG: response regulator [Pseudobdellovibrio sp.]
MKPRIAMIDDEGDIIESYSDLLCTKYDITAFNSAASFIAYFKTGTNEPFDMIVTDYNLGEQNGLDMIVELKKMSVLTPFLLMSGYLNKESSIKANNLGVTKILEKPVTFQALDQEIASSLLESQLALIQKKTRDLTFEVNAICSACSKYFNEVADRSATNQFFDILSNLLNKQTGAVIQHKYFEDIQAEMYRHVKTEELIIRQIQRKKLAEL